MGVHSGKWAALDGYSTIRSWGIEDRMALAKGIGSNTAMAPVRRKGVRSWSGQFGAYGGKPAWMPGETHAFLGYGAPENNVSGNGQLYDGDAIVDSVATTWSWQNGELVSHVVNFSGHLELAHPNNAEVLDASAPDVPEVCGTIIEADWGSGGYQEVPDLTQAVLTVNASNQPYVNSSTVVNGFCWTGRRAGPIDAMMSLTQQNDERVNGVFEIGDALAIKAWINDAEFWEILWFRVAGFTGIRADRETGAIIARTINLEMDCYSGALGSITLPGEPSAWWPFS